MVFFMGLITSSKRYMALKSLVISKRRESGGRICIVGPTPPDCRKDDEGEKMVKNRVANKVALITGGASGIGLTIAREFLKHNIKGVTIADVDDAQGELSLINLQNEFGPKKVIFTRTDVSDMAEFEASMKATVQAFRGFDILVNNAGMMDDSKWPRMIQVNLNGVINGCILAMEKYIPKYKSSDIGVVMNVASIAGLQSIPTIPVYVSTKHALIGLGKCLSAKFHFDATQSMIITICPGYYDTPLTGNYFRGRTLHKRSEQVLEATMSHKDFPMQSVDILGKAIMPIMQRSKNGSCWVIDLNNVSEVYLPEIKDLTKLQIV